MFQVFGCIFDISICLGSFWWQCKLDCLWWLRVSLTNDTIWIVNMAPCETSRVAVAWPLPTILINRFERRYNALRLLGCQTTVEILVFPMGQNFWQYCKVNALEGLEIDSFCPYCWKSWVRMFVLPFSSVHLSPVSFLRRNAKAVFLDDFLQQRLSHLHCQDLMYMSKFKDSCKFQDR